MITKTVGLPCSQMIRSNMADARDTDVIKLEDMYLYWRFQEPVGQIDYLESCKSNEFCKLNR